MSVKRRIVTSSKVTRKFQITLPKEVRGLFDFHQGDLILFVVEDGKLWIMKG